MTRAASSRGRAIRVLAGLAIAIGLVAACAPPPTLAPLPTAGPALESAPNPSLPSSPVDGVIVAVDGSGLSAVRGFTLRLADGSTIAFRLGTLDDPTQFPPGHLAEHQATSQPIRVYFDASPDGPVVYRLEDAPATSPASS